MSKQAPTEKCAESAQPPYTKMEKVPLFYTADEMLRNNNSLGQIGEQFHK